MERAIVIAETGAPEVLQMRAVSVGAPGPGELRIRQTAAGVNFHDVYVRSGLYRGVLDLPGTPGIEACGVVEEVGAGVTGFSPGDRVAYATSSYGGYASARLLDARLAVPVPAGVDDATAASLMVKGITAAVLVLEVGAIRPGDTVLLHAAAGGAGRLIAQWASARGATVVGTVGSEEKKQVALRCGCRHVIDYRREDFVAAVNALTRGQGVRVVFDSIGRDTFAGSLEVLARRGHLVNFGQSSGPVAPLEMSKLAARSLTVSRPIVFDYMRERPALERLAAQVFAAVETGVLHVEEPRRYALGDAAQAHRDLESRAVMGPPVLVP